MIVQILNTAGSRNGRVINHFLNFLKISDASKLKDSARNNFKFDENGRKFSKGAENPVGKGEIARYEQFLLFQHCFQKTCTADTCFQKTCTADT